jgi:hypothetical protein
MQPLNPTLYSGPLIKKYLAFQTKSISIEDESRLLKIHISPAKVCSLSLVDGQNCTVNKLRHSGHRQELSPTGANPKTS